jgi:hypothetical protein
MRTSTTICRAGCSEKAQRLRGSEERAILDSNQWPSAPEFGRWVEPQSTGTDRDRPFPRDVDLVPVAAADANGRNRPGATAVDQFKSDAKADGREALVPLTRGFLHAGQGARHFPGACRRTRRGGGSHASRWLWSLVI